MHSGVAPITPVSDEMSHKNEDYVDIARYDLEPLHVLEARKRAAQMTMSSTDPTEIASEVAGTTVAPPSINLHISRDEWRMILPKIPGHVLTYGPPGTGKSSDNVTWGMAWTAITSKPYYEINLSRQSMLAQYTGHWIDKGGEGMIWNLGVIARAMVEDTLLIINDLHHASDDVSDGLYFVLDRRPGAKFSLPNGDEIVAGPNFRCLCSQNGDPKDTLDDALLDRFQVIFPVNSPSREQIQALDPDVRKMCRQDYKQANGRNPRYTYRMYKDFCDIRAVLGAKTAASLTFGEEGGRAFIEAALVFKGTQAEKRAFLEESAR